jgi:DNA-binding transcriptional MerR regulator
MSTQPVRGYLSISEVLAELRADFPDVSVSKIRFLETEGLITPARSPSGYRRFCGQDVDRLRIILTAQRDQYLPLRVIKERLAGVDQPDGRPADRTGPRPGSAHSKPSGPPVTGPPVPAREPGPDEPPQALSRRELVEAAELSDALLTELETFGLVRRMGRQYAPESLQVARTAKALTAFGVEARHLRAVRAAAEREATMIESLVAPILRQRGAGARELASRTARDGTELVLQLHRALVEGMLTEAGLPAGSLGGASPPAAAEVTTDSLRRRVGGIGGATA